MFIVLLPGTFIEFTSARTRQTLLHASRIEDALVVYGDATRDLFEVGLDDDHVRIEGTLWHRVGPAMSFGNDAFRIHTPMLIDFGVLSEEYDGSWRREESHV